MPGAKGLTEPTYFMPACFLAGALFITAGAGFTAVMRDHKEQEHKTQEGVSLPCELNPHVPDPHLTFQELDAVREYAKVQTVFPNGDSCPKSPPSLGYTQLRLSTGKNIGVEFGIAGSKSTLRGIYNLDEADGAVSFNQRVSTAVRYDLALTTGPR